MPFLRISRNIMMRGLGQQERGSAIVEFITFALATLMPISFLLTSVFSLQRSAFTAQAAAREATRAFLLSSTEEQAFLAAQSAADQSFDDARLPRQKVLIACSETPCLLPSGNVRVSIKFPVSLMGKTWKIDASHEERVTPWM